MGQTLVSFDLFGELFVKFLPIVVLNGDSFLAGECQVLLGDVLRLNDVGNIFVTEITFGAVLVRHAETRLALVILIGVERAMIAAKDRHTWVCTKNTRVLFFYVNFIIFYARKCTYCFSR